MDEFMAVIDINAVSGRVNGLIEEEKIENLYQSPPNFERARTQGVTCLYYSLFTLFIIK